VKEIKKGRKGVRERERQREIKKGRKREKEREEERGIRLQCGMFTVQYNIQCNKELYGTVQYST
jgi:hypothetical protein